MPIIDRVNPCCAGGPASWEDVVRSLENGLSQLEVIGRAGASLPQDAVSPAVCVFDSASLLSSMTSNLPGDLPWSRRQGGVGAA